MAKKYEELTFTDDFMFGKVLYNNPDLCKELLELILNQKLKEIRFPETQKTMAITGDSKGIRLDVYTQDAENKVYDVEMQTAKKRDLPWRSRYYHGMLDLNLIERGMPYKNLPDCYVIFICADGIGAQAVSSYCMKSRTDPLQSLNDGTHTIFVNARGSTEGLSPEMAEFLAYIRTEEIPKDPDSFVARLQRQVIHAREHEQSRKLNGQ